LKPDPYIGIEEDCEKGLRIAREAGEKDLRGLLEFYWSITPEVEAKRAGGFVESVMRASDRGRDVLDWIEEKYFVERNKPSTFLDLGAGAGGLASVAAERYEQVVAVDRSFRWLVIARLRVMKEGRNVQLACANAEKLPFRSDSFDLIAAENMLEHNEARHGEIVLEAARVLRPKGVFFASTPNRRALLPDPHYRVWGLGLLSERWRGPAVRLVRKKDYRYIHLLGAGEVVGYLSEAGLQDVRIEAARFGANTMSRLNGWRKGAVRCYSALSGMPIARSLVRHLGPVLWASGKKPSADTRN